MSNPESISIPAIATEKLDWTNYTDWHKTVKTYLIGIEKEEYLVEEPPTNDDKKFAAWRRANNGLFYQILNSITPKLLSSSGHCNTVKELLDYLAFLFSGMGNLSRMHELCRNFFQAQQHEKSVRDYYIDFKQVYEEMKVVMSLTADLATRIKNMENLAIFNFLEGLNPSYENVRAQILSGSELPSLNSVFERVLRIGEPGTKHEQSVLAVHADHLRPSNNYGSENSNLGSNTFTCNYCREPGHIKKNCRKLNDKQARDQQRGQAYVATSSDAAQPPSPSAFVADPLTKRIIGKGYESGGHYYLEDRVLRAVFILLMHTKFTGQAVSKGFIQERWSYD